MSRFMKVLVALLAITAVAAPAMAATFEFHGDLNNRFNLYTNKSGFYGQGNALEKGIANSKVVAKDDSNTTWGDVKYRLWTKASTNDGKVTGVYAIELGAMRFGRTGTGKSRGAGYSGDGLNVETRWAYTQFQLPGVESKARVTIGLQPYKVNGYVWQETAAGVKLTGDMYELAWMRGKELFNSSTTADQDQSGDSFSARVNLKPAEGTKLGLFGLYQTQNATGAVGAVDAGMYGLKQFGNVDFDIVTLGVDGGLTAGTIFVNWDAIYQSGEIRNAAFTGLNGTASGDFDLNAYFLHADAGINIGASRVTYTTWYASGDDTDDDQDFDGFLSTDVDRFESVVLMEGGYTDDNYGTERPYILNKGLFLNKLAYDRKQTEKLKFGVSAIYLMTAEDIEYVDDNGALQSNSDLGIEFDAYVSYKLYKNVEFAINGGYLFAGDAMDAFEADRDGDGEENIYRITSRVRYKF